MAENAVETRWGPRSPIRLSKSDCHSLVRPAHRYPFTEPAVRPLAMYRCATTSKIPAGTMANTPAAITAPQSVE